MSDRMQKAVMAEMERINDATEQRIILGIERGERHVRIPNALMAGWTEYCLHAGPCKPETPE